MRTSPSKLWILLGLAKNRTAKLNGETATKKSAQIPVEHMEECKDLVLGHELGCECMPLLAAVSVLWDVAMCMSTIIHHNTDISMSDVGEWFGPKSDARQLGKIKQ
jgi:hypothetical protein